MKKEIDLISCCLKNNLLFTISISKYKAFAAVKYFEFEAHRCDENKTLTVKA